MADVSQINVQNTTSTQFTSSAETLKLGGMVIALLSAIYVILLNW